MKKRAKQILSVCLTLVLLLSSLSIGIFAAPADPVREAENAEVARRAAADSMVLLRNYENVLPLVSGDKVAVFGRGAFNTVYGGTGSGAVNNKQNISFYAGLNEILPEKEITMDADIQALYSYSGSATDYLLRDIDDAVVAAAAERNNKAIFVITRQSGEGSDRPRQTTGNNVVNQYELYDAEVATLNKICAHFENVIVVLNVGSGVDTQLINRPEVDSILCAWLPGQEAGRALADVLTGDVNPSGKLNDSWAIRYEDIYSGKNFGGLTYNSYGLSYTNNAGLFTESGISNTLGCVYYEEDIYVGYRYFDTFGISVAYPFGFGKSYTRFDVRDAKVSINAATHQFDVTAKVTNTGCVAGREVVQVYFSAPDSDIEKPYQELAGFAKTSLLRPGASEIVTISFDGNDLASYHEKEAAEIVDAGQYVFRVGNSSRNTHVAAVFQTDKVVIQQLTNQLKMLPGNEEILPALLSKQGATPIRYEGEAAEIAAAPVLQATAEASPFNPLPATAEVPKPTELGADPYPDTTFKLQAVYEGTIPMEDYIKQFSDRELAAIQTGSTTGITDFVVKSRNLAGSAAHSNSIPRLGVPTVSLPDGPAGLRITRTGTYGAGYPYSGQTYEHNATRFPNTSAQGCSWDVDLLEEIGNAVGREMLAFRADWWLAPALNIHRNPLNGRNFEYYAEDPYLTGQMAKYCTLGVQKNEGCGVTIKHYALNNQESNRNTVDTIVSERATREIYLRGFEICVKESDPMCIMTSYNRINGNYAQCSYDLCENITRGEWGFRGLIMTDWGARGTKGNTLAAGNDIIMPGESVANILSALDSPNKFNTVSRADLQRNAMRICEVLMRTAAMDEYITSTARLLTEGTIRPNQQVTMEVITPANVELLKLRNEKDGIIGQSLVSVRKEGDQKIWTVSFCLATPGTDRIVSIVTRVNGIYDYSGATVKFDVVPYPVLLSEASFNRSKVAVNEPFHMIISGYESIHKLNIVNETARGMGKTLISRIPDQDTHIDTWTYEVAISTAGTERKLTAIPYDKQGMEGLNTKSAVIQVD